MNLKKGSANIVEHNDMSVLFGKSSKGLRNVLEDCNPKRSAEFHSQIDSSKNLNKNGQRGHCS